MFLFIRHSPTRSGLIQRETVCVCVSVSVSVLVCELKVSLLTDSLSLLKEFDL